MKENYKIYGEGEKTIVLLHYFGGMAESWHWVIRRLKKRFRLMAITLPGFGGTKPLTERSIYDFAKFINDCIEAENLTDYLICGHSMSGKLLLYATQIKKKHLPSGLVLVAPSPPTIENMSDEEKARMLNHPDEEQALITVENATVRRLRNKKLKVAIQSQLLTDHDTWKWWIEQGMTNDISERIMGIEIPSFVICAKEDPVISMDAIYNEVMPFLKEPKLIQLSRCGHLIPLESPRRLAKRFKKIVKLVGK